jgi:uncharacterized OsmC-like protein
MSTSAASVIDQTQARLSADPASGRATPSVTATLINGRARLSAGPFNWEADLGPAIGGQSLAPSPTAYLLGALASCGVVFLWDTLGPQFGVEFEEISAVARCTADTGGLLGIEGVDAALGGIGLEISVRSTAPAERLDAVLAAWKARCPIYLAIRRPNDVDVRFSVEATAISG